MSIAGKRILLFALSLALIEVYQFNKIYTNEFITGDFGTDLKSKAFAIYGLIASFITLIVILLITFKTNSKKNQSQTINNSWLTIFIFLINYYITDTDSSIKFS